MVANHIRRIRVEREMSPTELAYKIGRTSNTVWRYEMGEAHPSLRTAQKIAEVLKVTLDDLFPAQEKDAA